MTLIKIWRHLICFLSKVFYKTIYRSKLKIGRGTTWRKNISIMIDKNARIEIGEDCFFNNGCSLNANESIVIGSRTIMGEGVRIYDHNHKFNKDNCCIKEQGFSTKQVKIGNDCWIGSNVVILKGTSIGSRCVIGAGVVLSGEISDGTIVKNSKNYDKHVILFEN